MNRTHIETYHVKKTYKEEEWSEIRIWDDYKDVSMQFPSNDTGVNLEHNFSILEYLIRNKEEDIDIKELLDGIQENKKFVIINETQHEWEEIEHCFCRYVN